ncbi:hypothetical protein DRN44_07100 [Thermococci archaeon]|nr:MAG: hypothetical protein DRN44_07100 [Thermococci archaeon]
MGIVRNKSPYLFENGEFRKLSEKIMAKIQEKLKSYDREDFLGMDEDELTQKLVKKYSLKPIQLNEKGINKSSEDAKFYVDPNPLIGILERKEVNGTKIIIEIPFEGSAEVFHYRPNNLVPVVYPRGTIKDQMVRIEYLVFAADENELKKQYDQDLKLLKEYITLINRDIEKFNRDLPNKIKQLIQQRKEKILADKKMLEVL